jgi:hypothetical protein
MLVFKHSSRKLPLKDSIKKLSVIFPDLEKSSVTPYLAGIQGHAAQSPKANQAPSFETAQAAPGCANPEEHHLGLGFYA